MSALQESVPVESAPERLRLVEGPLAAPAPLGAWTLFIGSLSACAGHGLFLFVALTRLRSLPSRAELGGALETLVIGWFVLCLALAPTACLLRARFLALAPRAARRWAGTVAVLTLLAFGAYLRAVAL